MECVLQRSALWGLAVLLVLVGLLLCIEGRAGSAHYASSWQPYSGKEVDATAGALDCQGIPRMDAATYLDAVYGSCASTMTLDMLTFFYACAPKEVQACATTPYTQEMPSVSLAMSPQC